MDLTPCHALAAVLLAELEDGDVVVVAQKAVSKAEGRVVSLDEIEPSARARELAGPRDPRHTEVILRESARVVRTRDGFVIAETRHGFVCASAGVDASNTGEAGVLVLLPLDPDESARRIRARLRELAGADVGVIVADSFGRAWRQGTTNVAIGASGVPVLVDLAGEVDAAGYELHATVIAVADELASAAELVMGKLDGVPVAETRFRRGSLRFTVMAESLRVLFEVRGFTQAPMKFSLNHPDEVRRDATPIDMVGTTTVLAYSQLQNLTLLRPWLDKPYHRALIGALSVRPEEYVHFYQNDMDVAVLPENAVPDLVTRLEAIVAALPPGGKESIIEGLAEMPARLHMSSFRERPLTPAAMQLADLAQGIAELRAREV